MPAKPAKKRQYKRRDPSTLKVSKTVAMYEWQWERFDSLRGRTARGKFLAAKLKLPKQPTE